MTPYEQQLLLTVARILRAHLRDQMREAINRADIADLNEALRPFEATITTLRPNQGEKP